MPRIPVDSIHDPRLDAYRSVSRTNLTRWSGLFIAEGRLVVERLLQSRFETVSLLVAADREEDEPRWVPDEIVTYSLPIALARELVGYNFHGGFLAAGRRRPAIPLAAWEGFSSRESRLTALICPHITNPENLGALIRIAACFGVDLVILGPGCCDPFSRRVLRISMGTAFTVPLFESENLAEDLALLKNEHGFELLATVLDHDAEPVMAAARGRRMGLLLGNEAHGLAPEWISRCDRKVTIPMNAGVDSLNVAVAAGIFLHHFTRETSGE